MFQVRHTECASDSENMSSAPTPTGSSNRIFLARQHPVLARYVARLPAAAQFLRLPPSSLYPKFTARLVQFLPFNLFSELVEECWRNQSALPNVHTLVNMRLDYHGAQHDTFNIDDYRAETMALRRYCVRKTFAFFLHVEFMGAGNVVDYCSLMPHGLRLHATHKQTNRNMFVAEFCWCCFERYKAMLMDGTWGQAGNRAKLTLSVMRLRDECFSAEVILQLLARPKWRIVKPSQACPEIEPDHTDAICDGSCTETEIDSDSASETEAREDQNMAADADVVKSEVESEAKDNLVEVKTEVMSGVMSGVKSEVKSEANDNLVEVKSEVMSPLMPEVKSEVKSDAKLEVKLEVESQADSAAVVEVKSEVMSPLMSEVKFEVKSDVKLEVKLEVELEVKLEVESQSGVKTIQAGKALKREWPTPDVVDRPRKLVRAKRLDFEEKFPTLMANIDNID